MTKEEIIDAKIKTEMEFLERIHEIKRIYDQFLSFAQIDDEFGYLCVCIIKDTVYFDLSSDYDAYEFFAGDSKC